MKPQPSLMLLDEIGSSIERNIATAHKCYDELVEIAPSALILRKFADFLVEVGIPVILTACAVCLCDSRLLRIQHTWAHVLYA